MSVRSLTSFFAIGRLSSSNLANRCSIGTTCQNLRGGRRHWSLLLLLLVLLLLVIVTAYLCKYYNTGKYIFSAKEIRRSFNKCMQLTFKSRSPLTFDKRSTMAKRTFSLRSWNMFVKVGRIFFRVG